MTHERVDAALVEEIEVFDLGNRAQSQVDRVALLPQQFGKPLDQGDLGVFGHPNDESAAGARQKGRADAPKPPASRGATGPPSSLPAGSRPPRGWRQRFSAD